MPPKSKVQLEPKWVHPNKSCGAPNSPLTELGTVEWFHPEHGVNMGGLVQRTNARQHAARRLFGLEKPQSVNPTPLNWVRWFTLEVSKQKGDLDENRLVDIADIKNAAKDLDIHPGIIWAIGEIETGNRGFLPNGIPAIRLNKEIHSTTNNTKQNREKDLKLDQQRIYCMTGSSEWSQFYGLYKNDKYDAISYTGFGRWQVLGINFAHRTVYVDPDSLKRCPPTQKAAEASPSFDRYRGLWTEYTGKTIGEWTGEIGELMFHKGYDLYKGKRRQGGFYQECAYDTNGRLVSAEKADATPNRYIDTYLFGPHATKDPGGPAGGKNPPNEYYLLRFFEDMHANEHEQLWYFTFVVKQRKNLLKAMQAVSKKPDDILLWEEVARLYNGPKHKQRGYASRLQKYFKMFCSKY